MIAEPIGLGLKRLLTRVAFNWTYDSQKKPNQLHYSSNFISEQGIFAIGILLIRINQNV